MHFEYLFDTPAVRQVFDRWIDRDSQAARLPRVYQIYYWLRPFMPLPVRQLLQRKTLPQHSSDDWCLPQAFYAELVEAVRNQDQFAPTIHPWPAGASFALVLTHDVETAEGMQIVPRIADLEQELGFRSSWNLVPKKYPIDHGLLRDLQARSFEIGVHGYRHDGQLFSSKRTFDRRADAINRFLKEFQAPGYRSPMVHRNLQWMQSLQIAHDGSCFDVDPFQPMPGGVGSIWPFLAGRFVELPYTMPQDHTLFVVQGREDGSVWQTKSAWLTERNAMVLMLTHPDYLNTPRRLNIYREFLERFREKTAAWHALPNEVATWWRSRAESVAAQAENGTWHIQGPARRTGKLAKVVATGQMLTFEPFGGLARQPSN